MASTKKALWETVRDALGTVFLGFTRTIHHIHQIHSSYRSQFLQQSTLLPPPYDWHTLDRYHTHSMDTLCLGIDAYTSAPAHIRAVVMLKHWVWTSWEGTKSRAYHSRLRWQKSNSGVEWSLVLLSSAQFCAAPSLLTSTAFSRQVISPLDCSNSSKTAMAFT